MIEFIFIAAGIIFIIIAFFRPSENVIVEKKIERILDDFVTRIDIDNDEMIIKIKQSQEKMSNNYDNKIKILEEKISDLKNNSNVMTIANDKTQASSEEVSVQLNDKYQEVIKLYQSGISVESIVKETGISHAEIKLIIELNKKVIKNV